MDIAFMILTAVCLVQQGNDFPEQQPAPAMAKCPSFYANQKLPFQPQPE
jgi:hypothetical protein